jgi:gas vesicle protein
LKTAAAEVVSVGFWSGLGIGAAIAVLYAPQAGTDTRESLVEGARKRAKYLKQKSTEAAAQVNTYVDAGKEQFGDCVEKGKQAVAQGRSQVEDYVDHGRKVVAEHASKVSAAVDAGKSAYTATTSPVDGQI